MPLTHPAPVHARPSGRFRRLAPWLVIVLLGWAPLAAQAQQCFVNGAFGMEFGSVNASGKASTSTIQYACQNYAAPVEYFHICLFMGPGQFSAGQPTRRMYNYSGGTYLNYDLFSDAAHSNKIGAPGTTPVYRLSLTVSQGQQISSAAMIHGLVYPGQAATAGNFQEQGISGTLRYRFSSSPFTSSADCSSGGQGGGTDTFNSSGVRAQFDNSCQIAIDASDMNFGQTPPPGTAIDATSNIAVRCPVQTNWSLGLNNGLNYSGGWRRMANAGRFVPYQLYLDAGRTQVWGNTSGNRYNHTTPANGATVNVTVYGRVPAMPTAAPGAYSDTITVTLTY